MLIAIPHAKNAKPRRGGTVFYPRKLFGIILVVAVLAICFCAQAAPNPCGVEPASYRGWKGLKLYNGLVSLYIVPEIGGRVIQFQLAEHPFFFVNPDLAGKVFPPEENGGEKGGWKNYGGDKLWPAPQGWENDEQWPGPPDPVLDGGKYVGEIVKREAGQVSVQLTSPPDARTGIQLSRTVSLFAGGTHARQECRMKNISVRPVRWSIWEVIQHDTADPADPAKFNDDFWAFCPLNPRSMHPKSFYPLFGQATHPSWRPDYQNGLLAVKYDDRVGKVGLDSSGGWLATANGKTEHCFVARFAHFSNMQYPDNASVEFWLNGAGEFIINGMAITNVPGPTNTPYLMESEILSPLASLSPGQEYQFQVDWFATRCPKPILEVTPAGAVSKRLVVITEAPHPSPLPVRRGEGEKAGQMRLEGIFGVFFKGRAEAVFKAADGKVVGREDLGTVEPDKAFRLSKQIARPENAFRVSVVLLDETGQNRGVLGNARLE